MKKLALALAFAAIAALAAVAPGMASYSNLDAQQVQFTINVTPSPFVYRPTRAIAADDVRPLAFKPLIFAYLTPDDPLRDALAFEPTRMSDVTIAQSNPQGNTPVTFTMTTSPYFNYFHIIPIATTMNAGYGANTYTCVYQVFAHFTAAFEVTDWVYGSNTKGGTPGVTTWPTNNYPTASTLQWLAEGVTTSFKAFSNSGSPGEVAFTGAANATKTICFDLSLTVPATQPSGVYQPTIQYNMLIQ